MPRRKVVLRLHPIRCLVPLLRHMRRASLSGMSRVPDSCTRRHLPRLSERRRKRAAEQQSQWRDDPVLGRVLNLGAYDGPEAQAVLDHIAASASLATDPPEGPDLAPPQVRPQE